MKQFLFFFCQAPKEALPVPVTTTTKQVSNKENGNEAQKPKRTQAKRKIAEPIEFEEGTVLTPAMQAVLNKKQNESKPKSRKK